MAAARLVKPLFLRHHGAMPTKPSEFESTVITALSHWYLFTSTDQLARLQAHYDAVADANRTMNLTRITEPAEAAVKHYADSLALLVWAEKRHVEVESVLDIGTGAGFPAVPLAIMRPRWTVTAIDSTAKKARFLAKAADALGLKNLRTRHAHSAHWQPERPFDMVVSRALARLPTYLKQASRLAAAGAWIIAYKTADVKPDETDAAAGLLKKLRISAEPRYPYSLELAGKRLQRALYVYRKEP